ncbi:MAG: hypothetical protein GXY33_01515 [Phycisphaerae bacterium]|nr:hypothetical protein [Phycisphaerae bacterium]
MNSQTFGTRFPLGSHLCREPMPPFSELKRDMANLKKHGFNLVKLQEHWMIDEPLEGRYDFSRYEELIEQAARLDMGVYLGLTCEQAPGWLYRKHPDCRMVGHDGLPIVYDAQTTLPADGKPGPCYDHPGAAADQDRFIATLVRTLGRFENIVVWNTWQEIGYWAEPFLGKAVCFCPHTLAAFRAYLRERFGDLDELNRAWNTRYLDWEYVLPDLRNAKHPCSQNLAWRIFMENVQIGSVLKRRAAVIRENDPLGRPVFAHKSGPQIGSGVDWTYARCQDFLGSSSYPAWRGGEESLAEMVVNETYGNIVLPFDHLRGSNRPGSPLWASEFQGGPISVGFHKGRVPSPADIRRWMLSAVTSGVTAISFWVTRAEIASAEMNGFSLLDSEGDRTPRFEEAARVGRALNRYAELFAASSWPGGQVAILVNEDNYQFCQTLAQGGENLVLSLRGWHRMCWENNIAVDFLSVDELDEPRARNYRAIVMPFPICLADAVVEKLARYVRSGGNLICEAAPGRVNEQAFANRGELSPAARELFGVSQKSFTMVAEPDGGEIWSPKAWSFGEYLDPAMLEGDGPLTGLRARANVYIETFACRGSKPFLLYNKAAAGTVRRVGRGKAWLLGTYIGHNAEAYRDPETQAFVRTLLAQCGAKPEREGGLLFRRRAIRGREGWFFTNPSEQAISEPVDVKGWKKVEDMLGEKLVRKGDTVELTVQPFDIRVLVLSDKTGSKR